MAGEYEEVYRALNPSLGGEGDWRSVLRAHGITHLILYDPDLPRLMPAVNRLAVQERDWTLLHLDGRALIVGWKDGERMLPAGVPAFDADRLAFAPAGAADERMLPPAPEHGPSRGPRVADFGSHFGSPVPPPSWESDAAGVLIHYFEDRAARQVQERLTRCFGWAAALPGSPALSAGPVDGCVRLLIQLERMPPALGDLSQRPPAAPLLAVRAARRALADNPDDANAYLFLGRAYLALAGLTPERVVYDSFLPLARLRHIQIAVALENALRRNPGLEPAHEDLANLYAGRNFLDAALDHRREAVRRPAPRRAARRRNRRGVRAPAGADGERHQRAGARGRRSAQSLHPPGPDAGAQPYRKAQLALRMGLVRLALEDVLMQSPMVLLGGEGIALQVELQLMLGRVEPVRDQLNNTDWQANKKNLGVLDLHGGTDAGTGPPYRLPAYDWLLLCQAAAVGDYEQADAALQALRDGMGGQRLVGDLRRLRRNLPGVLAWQVALSSSRPSWLPLHLACEDLRMSELLTALSLLLTEQADLYVLSGMLSLERGMPASAEESLETALSLGRLGSAAGRVSAGQPLAKAYLRIMQAAPR